MADVGPITNGQGEKIMLESVNDGTEVEGIGEDVGSEIGILTNDPLGDLFGETTKETVNEEPAVTASEVETVIEKEAVTAPTIPVEPVKDPDSGWKAAYFAEKSKRKALEDAKPKEEEDVTFDWTNPENTIARLKQELRQENQRNFLNLSEAHCKARNPDYGEKYAVFAKMAEENPSIAHAMLSQTDPAQYAYDMAKKQMLLDEIGTDPETYRAKIEAEIRANIEAEYETRTGAKRQLLKSLPPSAAKMTDKVPSSATIKDPLSALFPDQVAS
jgi:hypothetical protein